MLGAIAGDIIGSVYEFDNIKSADFQLFSSKSFFTDDTVLTVATADCLLNKGDYSIYYRDYFNRYPQRGYGLRFEAWGSSGDTLPYYSYGNGSAMRVSPVGFAFEDLEDVLEEAYRSASVTHTHPEGIKGAQAVASAIFLARKGKNKPYIKDYVCSNFSYELDFSLDDIREGYSFDETCQGSVPQAIMAFIESDCFEDSIRKAVSIGGDSDTIACIAGSISEAFYKKIPDVVKKEVLARLDDKILKVIDKFYERYMYDYR